MGSGEGVKSLYEAMTQQMEEMANKPKEEMGKREPGEVNTYELSNVLSMCGKIYKKCVREGRSSEFLKTIKELENESTWI